MFKLAGFFSILDEDCLNYVVFASKLKIGEIRYLQNYDFFFSKTEILLPT